MRAHRRAIIDHDDLDVRNAGLGADRLDCPAEDARLFLIEWNDDGQLVSHESATWFNALWGNQTLLLQYPMSIMNLQLLTV